jgi:hypothetical protein
MGEGVCGGIRLSTLAEICDSSVRAGSHVSVTVTVNTQHPSPRSS